MFNSVTDTTTLDILEKVAAFGERRHEVLAGNVANVDTPNYQMRDLPVAAFEKALSAAVHSLQKTPPGQHGDSLASLTAAARSPDVDELFPASLFQVADAPATNITFHDAGNRSIEHQMMELSKNAMVQNFVLDVMMSQMSLLQAMISERA